MRAISGMAAASWFIAVATAVVAVGCGNGDDDDGTGGASGGSSGVGGGAGFGAGTGGGVDAGVQVDAAAAREAELLAEQEAFYGPMEVRPDTDTTPVADCTGMPDMTLCNTVTEPDRWYDICVAGVCVSPGCGETGCNSAGPHFKIPPFDGHTYMVSNAAEGALQPVTVDMVTGLHWQTCAAGMSGANCGAGTELRLSWDDALVFCDELQWGGHDDWYLPDPYELMSIMDVRVENISQGHLSDEAFPGHDLVYGFYWTSAYWRDSDVYSVATGRNLLSFPSMMRDDWRSDDNAVRCVRRGASGDVGYIGERFLKSLPDATSAPDEYVIEDRSTGLVWMGCLVGRSGEECSGSEDKVTSGEARALCEDLVWAGSDDWRLPSYKEAHSLVIYPREDRDEPVVDTSVFDTNRTVYLLTRQSLFEVEGGQRVGIGIADATYPVMCVRWPD